jgi:hypothetical protein
MAESDVSKWDSHTSVVTAVTDCASPGTYNKDRHPEGKR